MNVVEYTGSADACCPITRVPLDELRQPVAFRDMPQHAYECDDLLEWLQVKLVNPLTNLEVLWWNSPLEFIGPVAGMMDDPGLVESKIILTLNGDAMQENLWVRVHAAVFLLATTDILTSQFVFYGDCAAIAFALGHWYKNVSTGSHVKKISFLTALSTLLAGTLCNFICLASF